MLERNEYKMPATEKKHKVFVITPFTTELLEIYSTLKEDFKDSYEFTNAGDIGNPQNIMKDIIQPIYDADVILANLTGLNANVMYELGIAHALDKKTIMITQDDINSLPFDLKQYRTQHYTTHFSEFKKLEDFLQKNFLGAVNETVKFSNPVQDFLKSSHPQVTTQSEVDDLSDGENGFVDYLAGLEEEGNFLNNEIQGLWADMNEMSVGVNTAIQKIKPHGNAVIAKRSIQEAATYINGFGQKFTKHNKAIKSSWAKMESNTLGILESKYVKTPDNLQGLIQYLRQLYVLKAALDTSCTDLTDLQSSMEEIRGAQKSLDSAINTTIPFFEDYYTVTKSMKASIDKILDKSKFVVGDIDFSQETVTESSDE